MSYEYREAPVLQKFVVCDRAGCGAAVNLEHPNYAVAPIEVRGWVTRPKPGEYGPKFGDFNIAVAAKAEKLHFCGVCISDLMLSNTAPPETAGAP